MRRISSTIWITCGVFLLFLAEAVLLQQLGGAYASGFGQHPDEAAHFVSSILVHDFIGNLASAHPMAYAKNFYLFYPKVAIGNWPPMLYLLMALWFMLFGISRLSALSLIAVTAAATATAMYSAGSKLISREAGLFAGALYLALPLIQESTAGVMTEHLVTLLILVSALQFARFVRTRSAWDALGFGVLASAAILTRGSAWALILVPPVVIALTAQWRLVLDWRLWLSAAVVGALCVPWYLGTRGMANNAMVGTDPNAPAAFFLNAAATFPVMILHAIGGLLAVLAALGAWHTLAKGPRSPVWSALAALSIGVLLIQCVVPAGLERRYMMQLLPAVLLFSAAGLAWALSRVRALAASRAANAAAWGVGALLVLAMVFNVPAFVRNSGYDQVAVALMQATKGRQAATVLLISDAKGEGSVISAVAARDQRPHTMVLRGTKVLVDEDWLGRNTKVRFGTDQEIRAMLDAVPVSALMIDHATDKVLERPYRQQVEQIIKANPQDWKLLASYDVTRYGKLMPRAVDLYVRRARADHAVADSIDMHYVEKLMQRN